MKKRIVFAGLLAAAALLAGCIYYQPAMSAQLRQGTQSVMSGEITTLYADAWIADQSPLSYEWLEDGVPLAAIGSSITWSRFVTTQRDVTIQVTVRSASGASSTAFRTITVSPAAVPATLIVVNDSPYGVHSLYASRTGETDWGPDQMRPNGVILPQGGTFTLTGIPAGTWDVAAEGANGTPLWTSSALVFAPGQALVLHLK